MIAGTVAIPFLQQHRVQVAAGVAGAVLQAVAAIMLVRQVATHGTVVVQSGGWPAPFGISLVADHFAALVLLAGAIAALAAIAFATMNVEEDRSRHGYFVFSNVLLGAVAAAFLTGDLFNLYVSFEVMLIASYGLMLLGGELPQLREGFKYVVVNLVTSAIFVIAAGVAYGLFGSLNMADIGLRLAEHGPDLRVTMVALMLALVFTTKAALFPFGFWLPDSYPVPVAAASAFFAALLTKVGAYAMIRSFTLMFPHLELVQTVVLVLAGVTVLFGGFGAIARQRWRHVLAFANIASVGYLLMGAFIGTSAGLAASLYYLTHSVLVVFALFLIAALAERISGPGYRVEGHLGRYPWLGVGYFVSALALAGVPPTSGFIGKFSLVAALFRAGGELRVWVAVAAVATGFLLLYAAMQIWRDFFWGESDAVHRGELPRPTVAVTAVAVTLVLGLALLSGPVFDVAQAAAEQLIDGGDYSAAVLAEPGRPLLEEGE